MPKKVRITESAFKKLIDNLTKKTLQEMTNDTKTTKVTFTVSELRESIRKSLEAKLNEEAAQAQPPAVPEKATVSAVSGREVRDPKTGLNIDQVQAKIRSAKDQKEMAYWIGIFQNLMSAGMI